jgi:hypothetical protein
MTHLPPSQPLVSQVFSVFSDHFSPTILQEDPWRSLSTCFLVPFFSSQNPLFSRKNVCSYTLAFIAGVVHVRSFELSFILVLLFPLSGVFGKL